MQIARARSERKELKYELLFDPGDTRDLRDLLEKLDIRAWERKRVQATPPLETQPDLQRRESTAFVIAHQPGTGAVELHDKTKGTDVRKLLGGGELPHSLQSALKQMAPDARVAHAQTDSGSYRGRKLIAETEKNLIQKITSHSAVVHRKDVLDMIPAVDENVRIAYSNSVARVLPVKEKSKARELGR